MFRNAPFRKTDSIHRRKLVSQSSITHEVPEANPSSCNNKKFILGCPICPSIPAQDFVHCELPRRKTQQILVLCPNRELDNLLSWLLIAASAYERDKQGIVKASKLPEDQIVKVSLISSIHKPAYFLAVDHGKRCVILCVSFQSRAHHCRWQSRNWFSELWRSVYLLFYGASNF